MVSIHRPLGYGPSTLPLRHSANSAIGFKFHKAIPGSPHTMEQRTAWCSLHFRLFLSGTAPSPSGSDPWFSVESGLQTTPVFSYLLGGPTGVNVELTQYSQYCGDVVGHAVDQRGESQGIHRRASCLWLLPAGLSQHRFPSDENAATCIPRFRSEKPIRDLGPTREFGGGCLSRHRLPSMYLNSRLPEGKQTPGA